MPEIRHDVPLSPRRATWQQVGSTAASKGAETGQYADLPAETLVGPVGLEPTTYGFRARLLLRA